MALSCESVISVTALSCTSTLEYSFARFYSLRRPASTSHSQSLRHTTAKIPSDPAMLAIAPSCRSKLQGPDVSQWNMYRSKIRRLYLEEKKTLKDVMGIMELENGFRGT